MSDSPTVPPAFVIDREGLLAKKREFDARKRDFAGETEVICPASPPADGLYRIHVIFI
ncbi:MAG: hypothetical protein KIS76_15700 [Pyrinomonadaceae bacterium]|nr:hypothetical protein [Pyrinomonadaceae bacterium]